MLYQRAALSSKAFAGWRSLIASQLSSLDSRNAAGRTQSTAGAASTSQLPEPYRPQPGVAEKLGAKSAHTGLCWR